MATIVSPDAFATGTKPAEIQISPFQIATGTKSAEIRIQPIPIATGTKPAEIRFTPVLTATGIKPPHIGAGPLLLATVSETEIPIRLDYRADTQRSVSKGCRDSADTLRDLVITVRAATDTARCVKYSSRTYSDTSRSIERLCGMAFDTVRFVQIRQSFDTRREVEWHLEIPFNTCRNVRGLSVLPFDTCRIVVGPIDVSYDTRRAVQSGLDLSFDTGRDVQMHIDVPSDTCRFVQRQSVIRFDTCRFVLGSVDVSFDTRRSVRSRVGLSFDTRRSVQWHVDLSSDTCRVMIQRINERFAAVRLIPHNLGHVASSGIQSVTMTLAESTLSDSFQVVTTFPVYPKDTLRGWIMDFPFVFQAEETREEGIRFTVKKTMYDADKMLYTPLTYSLSNLPTKSYRNLSGNTEKAVHASGHAGKIAAALGKQAAFVCDDFVPRDNYADMETTYQSVLSGLFGWTKNVPRMQVNVFIREGRLFFLQRGHERDVVDLANTPWFNHPTFDRKLMRTTWSQEAESTDDDLFTVVKSGNMILSRMVDTFFPRIFVRPLVSWRHNRQPVS